MHSRFCIEPQAALLTVPVPMKSAQQQIVVAGVQTDMRIELTRAQAIYVSAETVAIVEFQMAGRLVFAVQNIGTCRYLLPRDVTRIRVQAGTALAPVTVFAWIEELATFRRIEGGDCDDENENPKGD